MTMPPSLGASGEFYSSKNENINILFRMSGPQTHMLRWHIEWLGPICT